MLWTIDKVVSYCNFNFIEIDSRKAEMLTFYFNFKLKILYFQKKIKFLRSKKIAIANNCYGHFFPSFANKNQNKSELLFFFFFSKFGFIFYEICESTTVCIHPTYI